jgi:hypothetical protein
VIVMRALVASIGALAAGAASLPIVLAVLPFFLVARLARGFTRLLEGATTPWDAVIAFDPVLGWRPRPSLDVRCRFPRGVFHIRTDANGWRGHRLLEEAAIVVVGDSFAFGFGVDDARAFFSLTGRALPITAVGSPGHNMVQGLIWMQQLAPRLRGKLVVWFVCISNDLYDNLRPNLDHYRMPFVRSAGAGQWEIVTSHVGPEPWPCPYRPEITAAEKLAAVFGDNPLSERVYAAAEHLIREGRDLCQRAGAELAVFTIPWAIQLDARAWEGKRRESADGASLDRLRPDRRLKEICSRLEVPLVAAREHMRLRHHIPDDGHWNESGHRRVAALLARLYRDRIRAPEAIAETGTAIARRARLYGAP